MTVSLTWADIILTLLLGVFGSLLAALIYSRAPRWLDAALTAWAARSKKSARKRAIWIVVELDRIERFRKNPSELVADTGARIGSMVSAAMLLIMAGQLGVLLDVVVLMIPVRHSIDPSFEVPLLKERNLAIMSLAMLGIIFAFVLRLMWDKYHLEINRDLVKRKARLQEQLASLTKRLGVPEAHLQEQLASLKKRLGEPD
jgi:hypothetical protein